MYYLELQKNITELADSYKQDAKTSDDKSKAKVLKQIKQHYNTIKKCSDDKVELAYSTYELVSDSCYLNTLLLLLLLLFTGRSAYQTFRQ